MSDSTRKLGETEVDESITQAFMPHAEVPGDGPEAPFDPYGAPRAPIGGVPAPPQVQRIVQAPDRADPASRLAQPVTAKRRAGIIVIGLLVLLAIAAAFIGITYSLQIWGGHDVPDVVGMQRTEGERALMDAGFATEVRMVASDEEEDSILATDPEAGSRADEGSTVVMDVARPRVVPDVVGMTLDEALSALSEEGLVDIETQDEQSDAPEGEVLAVEPGAASQVTADAHIVLKVAVPHRVPDVGGMAERSAVRALEEAGYVASVQTEVNEDVEEGTVVTMTPGAGEALPLGSTVTIVVATHLSDGYVDATRAYLKGLSDIRFDGKEYEVLSVASVSFDGGTTCKYTLRARPFETQDWFGGDGKRRYGATQDLTGTIEWGEGDAIVSVNPALEAL